MMIMIVVIIMVMAIRETTTVEIIIQETITLVTTTREITIAETIIQAIIILATTIPEIIIEATIIMVIAIAGEVGEIKKKDNSVCVRNLDCLFCMRKYYKTVTILHLCNISKKH